MANPIKIPATVSKISDHGEGVYTLYLKPEKRIPRFKPGQFLHLTVDDYDPCGGFWPDSRVFSIASNPQDEEVVVCYSVKGKYTTKMRDTLTQGASLWIKMPYGDFVIDSQADSKKDVILVAGGTGISPYISFLGTEVHNPSGRKIKLMYGVRRLDLVLFPELINACIEKISDFSVDVFVENQDSQQNPFQKSRQFVGRISQDRILENGKQMNNPDYFLSGPPAMINFFKHELIQNNVSINNIKIDEWE